MVSKQKKVERIKVFVRFKPLQSEKFKPIDYSLKNNENGMYTLYLKNTDTSSRNRENLTFIFDEIFPSTAPQSMVFDKVASPMIDKFVQKGINCTIFSYGQTGSGKTYTICGLKQLNDRGIIHQTFGRLFDHVQTSSPGEKYEIQVSFIEIYNDQIRDLTKSKSDSVILFSANIKRTIIKSESSAIRLFENMKLKRKTSATNRNEHSSRSHLICTIYLTKYDHLLKIYDAEFNLVDLAGSESYDKIENRTTEFESRAVNESLYHLRQVIKRLADPNFKGVIPYRTSRLTWALENTLGGQCRVAMIANVDSLDKCLKESINTFEFATEIASIKKHIVVNTFKRTPLQISDEQRKQIETTFDNTEANNKNTETKNKNIGTSNENTETKIENLGTKIELIIEQALLKKPHDSLLRKDHDSSKQRIKEIILLMITNQVEQCMKLYESIDDAIVSQIAAKSAFAIDHESTLLESSDKSSIMQRDVQIDVRATIESNNAVEKRSVFEKFKTVGPEFGNAIVGLENAVSAAVGLGKEVVSVAILRNAVSVVLGLGTTVAIIAVLNWDEQRGIM